MTPQEAIDTIKIAIAEVEWDYPMDYAVAFEEAIKALEKQIPKTPMCRHYENEGERPYIKITCPAGCRVQVTPRDKYCPECGQRIDWGGQSIESGGMICYTRTVVGANILKNAKM